MSVAVSPDGRTLAVDLQGSIWTIPAAGGTATRITDVFNDARQPAWSPDGRTIAFFAYRDGGYDLWAIAPDGTNQRKLTFGAFDDREPAWSHDGRASRSRPTAAIRWAATTTSGSSRSPPAALRQLTTHTAEDSMPSWSANDADIAFVSTRDGERHVWAVPAARRRGTPGRLIGRPGRRGLVGARRPDRAARARGRRRAGSSSAARQSPVPRTPSRSVPAGLSATEFFYTADGKIRRRAVGGRRVHRRAVHGDAAGTPARYTRVARDFDSRAPRRCSAWCARCISPDGTRRWPSPPSATSG